MRNLILQIAFGIRMICQNLHRYKQRKAFPKCQNRQLSYRKLAVLVRVARLELAASWSQTRRPTNWATPGYEIERAFQKWSNMWSKTNLDQSGGEVK